MTIPNKQHQVLLQSSCLTKLLDAVAGMVVTPVSPLLNITNGNWPSLTIISNHYSMNHHYSSWNVITNQIGSHIKHHPGCGIASPSWETSWSMWPVEVTPAVLVVVENLRSALCGHISSPQAISKPVLHGTILSFQMPWSGCLTWKKFVEHMSTTQSIPHQWKNRTGQFN